MSRLLALALASALSAPLVGGAVPDLRMPSPALGFDPTGWAPTPRGRSGRIRTAGRHRPAGSKLWRKAQEKKLGLRW